ncbi:MAG TPA: helix-turn-helix transcriptional regulator [Ktedonobacteraceae bacterium]|nr:helix-turn-helix transcriptional regulator [Ktedonobacteraceae bacterium]
MNLAEKIKHLRRIEGELRGLNRPMTQKEVERAVREELHETISQGYLSQLENGKRLHLTASTRDLLARFFKVHPGYLVSDPPDYSIDLMTDVQDDMDRLNTWLVASAEEWRTEPVLHDFLQRLAEAEEPRRYLEAFCRLMDLSLEELEAISVAITNHDDEIDTTSIHGQAARGDKEI